MNRIKLAVITLSFLLAALLFGGSGCSDTDQAVAMVNGRPITRHQLESFINLMRLFNPELDSVIQVEQDEARRKVELEFLQILIDMELVMQEMETEGLVVDENLVDTKTRSMIDDLVVSHYKGSPDQFERRRKQLDLAPDDLSIIAVHELRLQHLFNHVTASISELDVRLFVEENPEMLEQAMTLQVYRFSSDEDEPADLALVMLQDHEISAAIEQLQLSSPDMSVLNLGWISENDPSVEATVKQQLFDSPAAKKGIIIYDSGRYDLYWIADHMPAQSLCYEDVREEAMLRKQYILYQDYFNTLWSEGSIEILVP